MPDVLERRRFKLVALDIDDTLVGRDQTIAPGDLAAIRRCIEAGVEVVLATGRTRPTTRPIAEQIGYDVATICNTGAITYDARGGVLRRLTVPFDLAREMLAEMRKDDIPVRVDAAGRFLFSHKPLLTPPGLEGEIVPDVAERLPSAPDQIIVFGRQESEWVIRRFSYLEGEVQLLVLPSHDEPYVVHILHPRATKGAALAKYCRLRGIERRETIAFGDSLNDFSLLSYRGPGRGGGRQRAAPEAGGRQGDGAPRDAGRRPGNVRAQRLTPVPVRRSAPRNSLPRSCAGLQDG